MKRRAILIGSPLNKRHPKYLEGVKIDLLNYKNFLMSSVGGAWKSSEIKLLTNPTMAEVFHAKASCANADIAIVVFSGHGSRIEGFDSIQLNGHESMYAAGLNTHAKRQITILDSCRVESRIDHYEGLSGLQLQFDQKHKEVARALYDSYLSQTDAGRFTLFSCSPNQYSIGTSTGSKFSNSLLETIASWKSLSEEINFPIVAAFQKIGNEMRFSSQNPSGYLTNETSNYFPIAVNASAYLKAQGIEVTEAERQSMEDPNISPGKVLVGLTVGILGLCLIANVVD